MCWRGHDPKRRNGNRQCLDCHAIRMRAIRHNWPLKKMQKYRLRLDVFFKYWKWGRGHIIADLAGLHYWTIICWIENRHTKRQAQTGKNNAEALAHALRLQTEQLWERVQ